MSTQPQTTDAPTNSQLATRLDSALERIDQLEETVAERDDRIAELEETAEERGERISELESELTRIEATTKAALKKSGANLERIEEIQARELEKGAHLLEENVPKGDTTDYSVDVADGRLEKITKDDGNAYLRVPESDDPLNRGGSTALAHGDLLPIQQLAQMDDEMLHSSTSDLPSRLAAKVWQARADETVGDNPWRKGSGSVREYLKSSDLRHWIRRQEKGVSEEYAKKLAQRAISRLEDFSNSRLYTKKKSERKNGLSYKETRVVLPSDADIPGETTSQESAPETDGVPS